VCLCVLWSGQYWEQGNGRDEVICSRAEGRERGGLGLHAHSDTLRSGSRALDEQLRGT
jgi:hypothetical protein